MNWFIYFLSNTAIRLQCWSEARKVRRLVKLFPKLSDPNNTGSDPYNNYAKILRDEWNKGHQPMILGSHTVTTEEEAKRLLPL